MALGTTTILLPTYNERENISDLIIKILETTPDVNILIIDDNSPDGTGALVTKIREKESRVSLLSRPQKEGLGRAYLAAFSYVLKDPAVETLVMMDADFSHDPIHIRALREALSGADVAIGSRYILGGGIAGWEWWRYLLSYWGNRYSRFITGVPLYDLTAGFYALRTSQLRKLELSKIESSGYAFQIDFKYRLAEIGARFVEVPIVFQQRRGGESKITGHIVREGLIVPWKLRFKK